MKTALLLGFLLGVLHGLWRAARHLRIGWRDPVDLLQGRREICYAFIGEAFGAACAGLYIVVYT